MWDADQYLKFASERGRPYFDLLARVLCETPAFIADLGCGPGNLTSVLAERWPAARVVGVDSSAAMLEQAAAHVIQDRLTFVHGNLSTWAPEEPLNLVISNAALQWAPDHERLLDHLTGLLAPDGVLAVQMPYHFQDPAHQAIAAVKSDPRWRAALAGVGLNDQSVQPLTWYVHRLRRLGFAVDAWQTTYLHVLTGPDPVLEWFKGTALRPLLEKLAGPDVQAFLADLGQRFRTAYPEVDGVTLLPFPRIFFVARRGEP